MRILLVFLLGFTSTLLYSQCLTGFEKLTPDPTTNYSDTFGASLGMFDDILVVGSPNNDSLSRMAGIAYIFKKENGEWKKLGLLKPSSPLSGLQFGSKVKVTADYVLIGCARSNTGVYIFKKPASGWQTMSETTIITKTGTTNFGFTFDLSADQQTLLISDMTYATGNGGVYVYHKLPGEEWSNTIPYQYLPNPDSQTTDFAFGGVRILNNKIACAATYTAKGGTIYVYSDASGNFNDFQLEARLVADPKIYFFNARQFEFSSEGIFTASGNKILHYKTPSTGIWQDSEPTCVFTIKGADGNDLLNGNYFLEPAVNNGQLILATKTSDNKGFIIIVKKTTSDWCGPLTQEIIYTEPPLPQNIVSRLGRAVACFNQDIVCSWVMSPQNTSSPVGLLALHQEVNNTFSNQIITKSALNANKFSLGTAMWSTDNFLFASALGERTIDRDTRGTVYIYKKEAGVWAKVNKLDQLPATPNDRNFGTSITGSSNYLAISAPGYRPSGKVFLYKAIDQDWGNPTLIQTIELPTEVLEVGQITMTDDWLAVAVVRNGPDSGKSSILFYKRNGDTWSYAHLIDLGNYKFSASIDMDGKTLVAGVPLFFYSYAAVIEYNATTNQWELITGLAPSDPDKEPFYIEPYGTAYFDGSNFGFSVDISGDKIFVGAPLKNFDTIKDVGAVYIFVRSSGGRWVAASETSKITPFNKVEGTLFGYSLHTLENTLIVGAPSTTSKGQAFVIQAKDYFWRNTIPLLKLTGDTFELDYYGYQVRLAKDDFFISAPLEDNASGRLAGTVYTTTPPPLLKLEQPICISAAKKNLYGYPFNGVWSGTGITNGNLGTFDPAVAGVGLHEITYKTPNCFYEGRLQIEVKAMPEATPLDELNQILCEYGSTTLRVKSQPNATYRWYYRKTDNEEFKIVVGSIAEMIVSYTLTGQYKAEVSNGYCSVFSPVFTVSLDKKPDIQIIAPAEICDPQISSIKLNSNYPGGYWDANGFPQIYIDQATQTLNISKLANGTYQINYKYLSENKCSYSGKQDIKINRLPKLTISRSGNLCSMGFVTLQTQAQSEITNYVWSYKKTNGEDSIVQNSNKPEFKTSRNGTYAVRLEKGTSCAVFIEPVTINDFFEVKLLPNSTNFKTCSLIPFFLEVETTVGFKDNYLWLFTSDRQKTPRPFTDLTSNRIELKETGFYNVKVSRNACTYTTETKFVEYSMPDTLFVPNIFTPNGDGYNDVFKVRTSYTAVSLEIFNREGRKVFSGNAIEGWRGDDAASGVYYWMTTFITCDEKTERRKGYLQLIR